MRVHIREKIYICGDFMHVDAFPVFAPSGNRRKRRFKPTSETQKLLNDKYALKHLEMLLETNFDDNDYHIRLSYNDKKQPTSDELAIKNISNYIRRLKYKCNKLGYSAPVAVWCTEKGKKYGRYHHHLIIKCELARDEIERMWGKGYANSRRLQFNENGLTGLSKYLPKHPIGAQRWHSTRNLKKPIVRENDNMSKKQFEQLFDSHATYDVFNARYKGYFVSQVEAKYNEVTGNKYLSFKMYRADSKYVNKTMRFIA
ncbi:MAG: hypothetical protein J6L91_03675 [Clostridia bacterium]|nr:hypothetical protein [Clostridia bacterium]